MLDCVNHKKGMIFKRNSRRLNELFAEESTTDWNTAAHAADAADVAGAESRPAGRSQGTVHMLSG